MLRPQNHHCGAKNKLSSLRSHHRITITYPKLAGAHKDHRAQPHQTPKPNPMAESSVPVPRQLGAMPTALGAVPCSLLSDAEPFPNLFPADTALQCSHQSSQCGAFCTGRSHVSLGLLQGSAAVTKATPRTPCIATCVCALTGDTAKGEWELSSCA